MLLPRFDVCLISVGLMALGMGTACSQDYPNKPVRILTSEPGGPGDFVARAMAQELRPSLGQAVIVDNRPSVIISGRLAATAPPDGYTLILAASNLWLQPFLRENVPFDPVKDFSPITLATRAPLVLVAHPSLPPNTVRELIAFAKAKPGALNYGSGNTASSSHLSAELFKSMTGVDMVRVAYKGVGPALSALIAGEVQLSFTNASATMANVKSGKMKALGVTSAEPSALFPGLPTVAASGVPGYSFDVTLSVLAPANTPAAVIKRLNQEMVRVLNQSEVKQRLFSAGQASDGSSPEQLAALIKSDMTTLGKVIQDTGIRE